MYPKVEHFVNDFFGIKVHLLANTFGFFVAMGFAIGSYYLYKEMKRKEDEGLIGPFYEEQMLNKPINFFELIFSSIVAFFVGYKVLYTILHFSEVGTNYAKFITSKEGSVLWGIIVMLGYLAYRGYEWYKNKGKEIILKKIKVFPSERVPDITIMAAIGGMLGAKLFHLLEYPEQIAAFIKNPISEESFSGLTMYGGLIVGGGLVLWYARKKKIGIRNICDAAAPAIMIAYAVGRLGCHFSGDGDWGVVNSRPNPGLPAWLWSYTYPNNVNGDGILIPDCDMQFWGGKCYVLPEGVWPTSVYEFLMCAALFVVLMLIRKRINVPGMLFSIYLVMNGLERFTIESIRVNSKYHLAGIAFTQAQLIACILMLLGCIGIYLSKKWHSNHPNSKSHIEEISTSSSENLS